VLELMTSWERQAQQAFHDALSCDQPLRVSWLAVLRAQCRNGGPTVPVSSKDAPRLQHLERRLPPSASIRLNAFLAKLHRRAPEVARLVPELLLPGWMLAYQAGRWPDPCRPWRPRGPSPGSYHIPDEKLRRAMSEARAQLLRHGDPITQANLLRQMGYTGDPRRVREWCTRLGLSWRQFRACADRR
jgi:hypothetical protein